MKNIKIVLSLLTYLIIAGFLAPILTLGFFGRILGLVENIFIINVFVFVLLLLSPIIGQYLGVRMFERFIVEIIPEKHKSFLGQYALWYFLFLGIILDFTFYLGNGDGLFGVGLLAGCINGFLFFVIDYLRTKNFFKKLESKTKDHDVSIREHFVLCLNVLFSGALTSLILLILVKRFVENTEQIGMFVYHIFELTILSSFLGGVLGVLMFSSFYKFTFSEIALRNYGLYYFIFIGLVLDILISLLHSGVYWMDFPFVIGTVLGITFWLIYFIKEKMRDRKKAKN